MLCEVIGCCVRVCVCVYVRIRVCVYVYVCQCVCSKHRINLVHACMVPCLIY